MPLDRTTIDALILEGLASGEATPLTRTVWKAIQRRITLLDKSRREGLTSEEQAELLSLRIDPRMPDRVAELAEKANEGLLTDSERAEYKAYIDADDFLSTLKLKARMNSS